MEKEQPKSLEEIRQSLVRDKIAGNDTSEELWSETGNGSSSKMNTTAGPVKIKEPTPIVPPKA